MKIILGADISYEVAAFGVLLASNGSTILGIIIGLTEAICIGLWDLIQIRIFP